jgi:drug/metabolite transporter (DMT)-like permease
MLRLLPSDQTLPAVGALVLNSLIWGISWLPFRFLNSMGLHSLWMTTWIYAVATLIFLVRFPGALRSLYRSPWLMALGLASGLTNASFTWGVTVGDVMRVVLLFFMMPVWAIILARLLLGEAVTRGALVRAALAVAGAVIVLGQADTWLPVPRSLPDWLGLIGGAGFALTNVLLRRQAKESMQSKAMAMFLGSMLFPGMIAAIATAGAYAQVTMPVLSLELAVLATLTAGLFIVANLLLQYGAAHLPANVTAVVSISEIPFAALSAWLIGGEPLTGRKLLGGAFIVTASVLAAMPHWRKRSNKPSDIRKAPTE